MDLIGETALDRTGGTEPVHVDPDALVRLAGHLGDVAGEVSREIPSGQGLTSSPPGWSVTHALVGLNHAAGRRLTRLSGELSELSARLRAAGLDYTAADASGAARMPSADMDRDRR